MTSTRRRASTSRTIAGSGGDRSGALGSAPPVGVGPFSGEFGDPGSAAAPSPEPSSSDAVAEAGSVELGFVSSAEPIAHSA
jgi:hypothetical protein